MIRPLPAPVARFRDLSRLDGPRSIETVVIDTAGWMRRPGMPPLPLEIRMAHRLGHEFVHDIRVGRRPLAVRFGLDAYIEGRGLMRVGPSLQAGPEFDQGALIALWSEALDFPSAWESRADIRWEPLDDGHALLVLPGPEGEIPVTVGFDAASGCPDTVEADRYRARGPKVRWRGTSSGWRRFDGVLAPARFVVQWLDEPLPWLELRTRTVLPDVAVANDLERGRRALRSLQRRTASRDATS